VVMGPVGRIRAMLCEVQYAITRIETRNIFFSQKSTDVTASRDVMVLTLNVFWLVCRYAVITSHSATDTVAYCSAFPTGPCFTQTRSQRKIIDQ
jgi:hypothetical protein